MRIAVILLGATNIKMIIDFDVGVWTYVLFALAVASLFLGLFCGISHLNTTVDTQEQEGELNG
jgi:hypothetical protein